MDCDLLLFYPKDVGDTAAFVNIKSGEPNVNSHSAHLV